MSAPTKNESGALIAKRSDRLRAIPYHEALRWAGSNLARRRLVAMVALQAVQKLAERGPVP